MCSARLTQGAPRKPCFRIRFRGYTIAKGTAALKPGAATASGSQSRTDTASGEDSPDDLTGHVGEAEVTSGGGAGELRVVEAERVEYRGEQVVEADLLLVGVLARFVGGAAPSQHIIERR